MIWDVWNKNKKTKVKNNFYPNKHGVFSKSDHGRDAIKSDSWSSLKKVIDLIGNDHPTSKVGPFLQVLSVGTEAISIALPCYL